MYCRSKTNSHWLPVCFCRLQKPFQSCPFWLGCVCVRVFRIAHNQQWIHKSRITTTTNDRTATCVCRYKWAVLQVRRRATNANLIRCTYSAYGRAKWMGRIAPVEYATLKITTILFRRCFNIGRRWRVAQKLAEVFRFVATIAIARRHAYSAMVDSSWLKHPRIRIEFSINTLTFGLRTLPCNANWRNRCIRLGIPGHKNKFTAKWPISFACVTEKNQLLQSKLKKR